MSCTHSLRDHFRDCVSFSPRSCTICQDIKRLAITNTINIAGKGLRERMKILPGESSAAQLDLALGLQSRVQIFVHLGPAAG